MDFADKLFAARFAVIECIGMIGHRAWCAVRTLRGASAVEFSLPSLWRRSAHRVKTRNLYQCSGCLHQTSLTSGMLFELTKLPLTTWFLAIYLITQAMKERDDRTPSSWSPFTG